MKAIACALYALVQWTWGFPQSLLGLMLLVRYRHAPRSFYHGAVCVMHDGKFGGVSLGMFIFVNGSRSEEWIATGKVHEYGHTVQSLVLGPLYLFVIGLPSALWCSLPSAVRYRRERGVSYYAFYPESWANAWGAAVAGDPEFGWVESPPPTVVDGAESAEETDDAAREVNATEKATVEKATAEKATAEKNAEDRT